jgi:hypothetical protein
MRPFSDLLVIDADAHVMEPEDAFAARYFDPAFRERRPRIVEKDGDFYWMVDDALVPRLKGARAQRPTDLEQEYPEAERDQA